MSDFVLDKIEWIVGLLITALLGFARFLFGLDKRISKLESKMEVAEKVLVKVDGWDEKITDIWKALAKGEVAHEQ